MTRTPARRLAPLAVTTILGALLAGCGPSQQERVTSAITAYDNVTTLAVEAHTRVHDVFPDLDLTTDTTDLDGGAWRSCSDEPYNNTYDSPDGSAWLGGNVYTLLPRQPTDDLIEPLAQTYLDDGWTLTRNDLDNNPPQLQLRKDDYYLTISGTNQGYLDRHPDSKALLKINFSSICLASPDNLTEWDPADPHNFDLARRTDQ